jgi:hypothetical protein
VDLDKAYAQMQAQLQQGDLPSSEKIKEYIWACFAQKAIGARAQDIGCCLREILRIQELLGQETDDSLKESLMLVEAGMSAGASTPNDTIEE